LLTLPITDPFQWKLIFVQNIGTQFLFSALEENFADIAEMYSKFAAWQPKLFKLIFVQNIGRKLLLALKIFAEMCLNFGNPSLNTQSCIKRF
jgi:hypothetical protein